MINAADASNTAQQSRTDIATESRSRTRRDLLGQAAAMQPSLNVLATIAAVFVLSTHAFAQDRDLTVLPPIETIDAQTDITVFLRTGVPAELRTAALRRAWMADPAIHDFKGLQESDWDFDNANSIPGFGEIGPDVDVKRMVAEILGETPPAVAQVQSGGMLASAFRSLLERLNVTSPAVAGD